MSRRGWAVAALLAAVVALAAAGLLAAQLLLVTIGLGHWESDRPDEAENAWSKAEAVSVLNRWVPLFNRGTARYSLARWDAAAEDFEAAARIAPEDAQCQIRLNWSLALEAGGDGLRENDPASALARYQEAQLVLAQTSCPDTPSANGQGSLSEQQNDSQSRLDGKRNAAPAQQPTPQETDPDSRSKRLEAREKQAAEQRARAEESGSPTPAGKEEKTW